MSVTRLVYTDEFFNGLLSKVAWDISSSNTLTYSIPNADSHFVSGYGVGEPNTMTPLQDDQVEAFESILNQVESFTQLDFVRVADSANTGTVRIAFSQSIADDPFTEAWAYFPAHFGEEGGDIWLNPNDTEDSAEEGGLLFFVMLHELGHALGLSHSFEAAWRFPAVPTELDSSQHTVMSYTADPDYGENDHPASFMPLDIAALQYIYGVNENHNSTGTAYFFDNSTPIQTVWDAGGIDRFDFSRTTSGGVDVNLGQGEYSSIGIDIDGGFVPDPRVNVFAIAHGTDIENLVGSDSADRLTGNELDNSIWAEAGDDLIDVVSGINFVDGGTGVDTLVLAGESANWLWDFSGTNAIAWYLDADKQVELTNIETIKFDDLESSFEAILAENEPQPDQEATVRDPDDFLWDNDLIGADSSIVTAEDAQVYRLYLGSLGRIPDQDGFDWWSNEISQGVLLETMAAGFYWSDEFQALADADASGQVSNTELLDHLYATVLEREIDEDGYNWWLDQLDAGAQSEEQVLTEFTQSNEYVLLSLNTVTVFDFLV
ncbi:DUF4214 domain-containing protein [Motiliproteus sp. MSK22-1]|uniref:DUF4214 domain-containing protein n=1 Tax=Motiliproteus sp. MSK22-1 TaxID=1897630 RepID=UPI000976A1E0|nr:DUF4214 domain-containing protein [Motiliproteus sp. MSK22-1]OMH30400.1 hypothetical protein BGP75_18665 [Motiliproteus sp. MSK22-1]